MHFFLGKPFPNQVFVAQHCIHPVHFARCPGNLVRVDENTARLQPRVAFFVKRLFARSGQMVYGQCGYNTVERLFKLVRAIIIHNIRHVRIPKPLLGHAQHFFGEIDQRKLRARVFPAHKT